MAQEISRKPEVPAQRSPVDAWGAMRNEMDQFFNSVFGGGGFPALRAGGAGVMSPSIDVHENEKEITIEAELPGIEEKDVQLSFRDGVLSIKGEKKSERDETKNDVHISERSYGSFQRAFRLPDTVEVDKAAASFDKGVLKIVLPKSAEAVSREKKIPIGNKA